MVNVVRILVTKLIKQNSLESAVTYSKAVKAAFFLFNLLGITYILFFLSPGDGAGEIAFFYVNAIFQSFQGFLVCLIYCLSNSEILNAIGRNWRKWRHNTRVPCFEKDLRVRRHSTQSTSPTTHFHVTVKLDRHCDESGTERPEQLPSHHLRSVILHETSAPTLHPAENHL
ncbi:unnamed protein product [Clavelina lepadiformis]|uniref:G-protein coupled receptors family 2 profile 2 domain-containing protein n=1 Tax=Clavelina lepadiformis TaxID=159417 RepID=A0ABP0G830_CLALP